MFSSCLSSGSSALITILEKLPNIARYCSQLAWGMGMQSKGALSTVRKRKGMSFATCNDVYAGERR